MAPEVGATSQFAATATLSDGTTQTVTSQAAWQSSNTVVVTVSSSGLVTGVGLGEADVSATYSGAAASQHVKLVPRVFSVTGLIRDAGAGNPIDAEVEVIEGANAGQKVHADGNGLYTLSGLQAGALLLRARATGYQASDSRLTIATSDMRADFELRPESVPPPPPSNCVSTRTLSVSPNLQGLFVDITSACPGTIGGQPVDVPWITVRGTTGGGIYLDVIIQANPGPPRTGHIVYASKGLSQLITVEQDGQCVAQISPTIQHFGENGGSGTVSVTASGSCTWQARNESALFLTITGGAQGTGNGTVTFTVPANPTLDGRSGNVNIGGLKFGVTQDPRSR